MEKTFTIVIAILYFAAIGGWALNVYKFAKLDFEKPYKAEVLRGVGIVTGVGAVMGYVNISD